MKRILVILSLVGILIGCKFEKVGKLDNWVNTFQYDYLFNSLTNALGGYTEPGSVDCAYVMPNTLEHQLSTVHQCIYDSYQQNIPFSVTMIWQDGGSLLAKGFVYSSFGSLTVIEIDSSSGSSSLKSCKKPYFIDKTFTPPYEFFRCPNNLDPDILSGEIWSLERALKEQGEIKFVELLESTRGSVGKFRSGSFALIHRNNPLGIGLYASANHVFGVESWLNWEEEFIDPYQNNTGIFLSSQLPPKSGDVQLGDLLSANFSFYHPKIDDSTTNVNILPKDDFYLGVIDSQTAIESPFGVYPGPLKLDKALEIYDPTSRTLKEKTWSRALVGEVVFAIGYPQDTDSYPNGAVSLGTVYSDQESVSIIEQLQELGDEEGNIDYNSEVEFITNAGALQGMSGGGVFDEQGALVGIMVRGTKLNGESVTRVVRLSYIKQVVDKFKARLDEEEKAKFKLLLGSL